MCPINSLLLCCLVHSKTPLQAPRKVSRNVLCINTELIINSVVDETAVSKEAYSALAVLLYEAARVDADSAGLK